MNSTSGRLNHFADGSGERGRRGAACDGGATSGALNLATIASRTQDRAPVCWNRCPALFGDDGVGSTMTQQARSTKPRRALAQAFLVSQKISAISSILASSWSATAASIEPLVPVAPASLVASLTSVCSWGYFSKCGGLK
jgi:hypothetical protein